MKAERVSEGGSGGVEGEGVGWASYRDTFKKRELLQVARGCPPGEITHPSLRRHMLPLK